MLDQVEAEQDGRPGRGLSGPWLLVVVIVYAGIIQGLGRLIGVDTGHSDSQFAVVVSTSGRFFYLCLRVGGTIVLPMLVHGLWDISLLSNLVGDEPQTSLGMFLVILLQVTLIIVLLVRRRTIEPAPPATPG